jgi:hypothetical protein
VRHFVQKTATATTKLKTNLHHVNPKLTYNQQVKQQLLYYYLAMTILDLLHEELLYVTHDYKDELDKYRWDFVMLTINHWNDRYWQQQISVWPNNHFTFHRHYKPIYELKHDSSIFKYRFTSGKARQTNMRRIKEFISKRSKV